MNKNNSPSTARDEVFYAIHEDHLHSYPNRGEAEAEAKILNSPVYSASELLFALDEQNRLRSVAYAAAEVLAAHAEFRDAAGLVGGCECGTCELLRQPVLDVSKGIVVAYQAGKLDSAINPQNRPIMDEAIETLEAMGVLEKAEVALNRNVRVVASRARQDGLDITPLIGQEYTPFAVNPETDEVKILAKGYGFGGPIVLGPDEYVFADELVAGSH